MTVASASSMSNVGEDAQLLDTIERWTMRELKPIVREYDHADRYPAIVVEQMKELGLFGATVSEEYG
ncbi:MAG: acyl-CoA dehydrogenase family protein, partial [Pseudolabrys sp.]